MTTKNGNFSGFLSILTVLFFLCIDTLKLYGDDPSAQFELRHQYELSCTQPSDINEHVHLLRSLAMECSSVVEIGLRTMISSWGIFQGLSENPSSLRSYLGIDIDQPPEETLNLAQKLAEQNGIAFRFWQANDRDVDIEPAQMLFIDSLHTYCHLTYELEKFSPKISKYIAFHDTSFPWEYMDDNLYSGDHSEYPPEYDRNKRGLWPAIEDFLQRHPEWVLHERYFNNYGFTILRRALPSDNYQPKIYDCFLFYNELEILEIKLNELYEHVDHFVLVEASETFRGNLKPFYFNENKHRFAPFLDKIIHVMVNEHFETDNPWLRETYQRNQILKGLTGCDDRDIIIIEDLDEIIRGSKLSEIIAPLLQNRFPYVTCTQTLYTYFLNRNGQNGQAVDWLGSVAAKYADVKLKSPDGVRNLRNPLYAISEAGWHFSYMGGLDKVRKKLESFSHSELDNEHYKNARKIREDIAALELVEIDETYPQFVRNNIAYFEMLGLIDQK